jgi:RNA polymerase sigma-70 factor (ECF subfamily)
MSEPALPSDSRTCAADLFELHHRVVAGALSRRFPGADPQLISDALVEAVLQLSADLSRYDPARGPVRAFLIGAARRLLLTRLRSERRRREREQKKAIDPVTAEAAAARSPLEQLADRDLAEWALRELALADCDRRALDLWLLGETDEAAYAEALRLPALPPDERTTQVRRALARLRQRLHRLRRRLRPEETEP